MTDVVSGSIPESSMLGRYIQAGRGRTRLLPPHSRNPQDAVTVEDWVAHRMVESGKVVLRGELGPFGNIFGGLMYPALTVPEVRYVDDPDPWPSLEVANAHIAALPDDRSALVNRFQENLDATRSARDWFTTEVSRTHELAAAVLLSALPPSQTKVCLAYLMEDYWGRRAGWPDLILLDLAGDDIAGVEFVEVKSHKDRLRADQRAWFCANAARLHLPAQVLRIVEDGPRTDAAGCSWPYEPPTRVWAPDTGTKHPLIEELVTSDREWRDRVRIEVADRRASFAARQVD